MSKKDQIIQPFKQLINYKENKLGKCKNALMSVLFFPLRISLITTNKKYLIIMKSMILLTLYLVLIVQGGRILNGDLTVDYANAGSMTQLSFSFMLSNSLTSTDYILVALPFPFHSQLIPAFPATEGLSSPLGLLVTYQMMNNDNTIQPTIYYARVLTDTIDSSNYYIQFYNTDRRTIIDIPANQWYMITFKIQTSAPLAYQTSNSVLQIQMSSVSSVWPNAMVYDDNLAFNYFQLAASPNQLITLAATPYSFGSAGGYLLTQKVYSLYLDIALNLPTYYYNQNLVLKFAISEANSFLFNGVCSSVAKTNAPKINALNSNTYSCAVDLINNLMIVTLKPSALIIQQSFRFSVGFKNPSTISQGASINVYAVQQYSPIILGYGSASGVLSTNQLYVTYQEIFLGWGLRPDALLPFDARVYRGNAATPTYMPYNSLSLKFSISQATSSAVELKVVIKIPSEATAFVLPSGFSTNLPSFLNKQAVCVVEYASSTTNRQIGCTGIGALSASTVYYVGWKMYFPYDNYQSSINCSQFGLLTIYTTTKITASSYSYYLGRGDSYLNYLKSSSNYVVIGRNSTYINYMTTFPNVNLVVLSSDFQQFLSQPQTLFINNRPAGYLKKQFNDVYVITQNLAFLTYMSLFTDIYCAVLIPQDTDIVNGYGSIPLVATTTPKNTLTITTSNSQDWTDFSTNFDPLVSSTVTLNSNTVGSSLLVSASAQSIIFKMKVPYASITTTLSNASIPITNNWGMMIMMSPSIKKTTGTLTVKQSVATQLTPSTVTYEGASAYNPYTIITLRGSVSDALQTSFKPVASLTSFGLSPFLVNSFSSIYADDNNLDIMIATVDGIDGPQNKMTFNGYFLINGFSYASTAVGTTKVGLINYQTDTAMDGSKVPTLLRIKGTISNNATALDSLVIFFDQISPFFSNKHAGEIFCYNTDNTNPCKYYQGPSTITNGKQYYNYQKLSRFQIPVTAPSTQFNILIPVTYTVQNPRADVNLYIAFQTVNSTSGFKSLAYVESRIVSNIVATATTSGTYGPQVNTVSYTPGQQASNLVILANSGTSLTTNTMNNLQLGSAFSYFSKWDYFKDTVINGWTAGTCRRLNYLYYYTNYAAYLSASATFSSTYYQMSGVVCDCDTSGAITTSTITLVTGYLPAKWGITVPGWSAISQQSGALLHLKTNVLNIGGPLTTSGISFPAVGPSMTNAVGEFSIPLPVALDQNVQITIKTPSLAINLPFAFTGTCAVYYNGVKARAGCNFAYIPTQVDYTLTILQSGIIPAGTGFSIIHYGLTSNSSYNSVTVSVTCYSLMTTATPGVNDIIFSVASASFAYQDVRYIGPSLLTLNSFTQWTQVKAAVQSFNFTFVLLSKGLYVTNRVRFSLGQFALDNSASSVNPSCKIYKYTTTGSTEFSHDWAAVDVSGGFSSLELWPSKNLLGSNLTYTVKCINFLSTSSPTPISITSKIVNTSADLTGQISQNTGITLPVLGVASTTAQITLSKSFSIPSIGMEMSFLIVSPGVNMDSFLYLNFPSYYSNGLGSDIKCYSPSGEIFCNVVDRFLTIQYLGIYPAGTSFTITITGVVMAINYNSGTFSYIFDSDNDLTSILTAGTFTDSISSTVLSIQNFPTINIFAFSQSSAYLRQSPVTVSLTFYLPTSLKSIGIGQTLFLVVPVTFSDVLRFVSPSCTLNILGNTLKNYVSTCTVLGMRIKMPFLDNLVLGSTYTLTVNGLINPTNPTSNVYRYSLEITDTTGTSILAKSYSVNCNYNMPIFIPNPITIMLNYYLLDGTLVTNINTMTNVQSFEVYIAPSSTVTTALYARNTYLSPLSSLQSNPSNIDLLAGSNPFPIRLSSSTSGVNYLYFSKSGDGGYYNNLPPLIMTTSKNYFTAVSFIQSSFKLPVSTVGSNYSLIVTLPSSLYPINQVDFTVTLSSARGISMKTNPTVISFYPGKVQAIVNLYINDATLWVVAATTNLVFTPAISQTTYATGAQIPLTAVASAGTPTLTLTAGTITKTSLSYSITCSQEGKFIYHLARSFSYNTTACDLNVTMMGFWLGQSSLNSLRVSESYFKCQDVIGAVNVDASTAKTLTLSNLQASTSYKLNGYCETQGSVQTAITPLVGATLTNGGSINVINFVFSSALTTAQKIKLVCALALNFKIDYTKVSTWDGYYCSQLLNRRRLQQVPHARLLVAAPVTVPVFFGINTYTTNDASSTTISTQAGTQGLKDLINLQVTGLPTLSSTSVSSVGYTGANEIQGTLTFFSGPNYLSISNIMLQNSGLVYVIVGDPNVWTRAPVVSEIKTGSGPNGLPPVFYRVLPFATGTRLNMAWTSFTGGPYTMYIVASDNNPFDNANFGVVKSYSISVEVPSWGSSILFVLSMGLLLFLL